MKFKLPKIQILIISLVCGFTTAAQTEKNTAPVKWETYKNSDKKVSISMPKLPVLITRSNGCSEETKQFGAYADRVVYGLNITSKIEGTLPEYCRKEKKFSEDNFKDRFNEIKADLKTTESAKIKYKNFEMIKIQGKYFTYWLIDDYKNFRWFELWITESGDAKQEVVKFLESIDLDSKKQGIEIGEGSPRTLGDENFVRETVEVPKQSDAENVSSSNLRIAMKPRPAYTDIARQASITGTTRLRVVFLANGGIGSVSVVTGLPYGLTEQAIAAAKKIVFIPAMRNNTPVTVTKQVEYSFSIY